MDNGTRGLEVHVGFLRVKAQRCVVRNVLLQRDGTTFGERNAARGLTLQVGNGNGDVPPLLLEPLRLLDHHGVTQVHLAAWHEAGEYTEIVAGSLGLEDLVNVAMGKDDAATMELRG